jgi:hypothetical protein
MIKLSDNPHELDLEDFVAAHFGCRGAYVETGVTERNPTDVSDIDVVWTDYRRVPAEPVPVEVKSGECHLRDIFKFYGWTRYLSLPPGQFVHTETVGSADRQSLQKIEDRTGIKFIHVEKPNDAETHLETLGLPKPTWADLPDLWRFSFWTQRRLIASLGQGIKQGVCPETAKRAKEYYRLINDAVFFMPDVPSRVEKLLEAHLGHQQLARSAALELEKKEVNFTAPANTMTFRRALYDGKHYPVQACMYLSHRARLYVVKAAVDYSIGIASGAIKTMKIKVGDMVIDFGTAGLHNAFVQGVRALEAAKSFRLFPTFWQSFLYTWGGFFLLDRLDNEYAQISKETGVPVEEIPVALTAFDTLFPVDGGWMRKSTTDKRWLVMMMPAALRGLGSARRLGMYGCEGYSALKYRDYTTKDLSQDNDAVHRILSCKVEDLAK